MYDVFGVFWFDFYVSKEVLVNFLRWVIDGLDLEDLWYFFGILGIVRN